MDQIPDDALVTVHAGRRSEVVIQLVHDLVPVRFEVVDEAGLPQDGCTLWYRLTSIHGAVYTVAGGFPIQERWLPEGSLGLRVRCPDAPEVETEEWIMRAENEVQMVRIHVSPVH